MHTKCYRIEKKYSQSLGRSSRVYNVYICGFNALAQCSLSTKHIYQCRSFITCKIICFGVSITAHMQFPTDQITIKVQAQFGDRKLRSTNTVDHGWLIGRPAYILLIWQIITSDYISCKLYKRRRRYLMDVDKRGK